MAGTFLIGFRFENYDRNKNLACDTMVDVSPRSSVKTFIFMCKNHRFCS
jgi:hypothetical protein